MRALARIFFEQTTNGTIFYIFLAFFCIKRTKYKIFDYICINDYVSNRYFITITNY